MYRLSPHPATPPVAVSGVSLLWMHLPNRQHMLTWKVESAGRLIYPSIRNNERADNLWKMTCFELFLRKQAGPDYFEFNFSPSKQWAAYSFTGYREGMTPHPMDKAPTSDVTGHDGNLTQRIMIEGLPAGMTIAGISAVIIEMALEPEPLPPGMEETVIDGAVVIDPSRYPAQVSYWSLLHPSPQPDFHHPASFSQLLPPGV